MSKDNHEEELIIVQDPAELSSDEDRDEDHEDDDPKGSQDDRSTGALDDEDEGDDRQSLQERRRAEKRERAERRRKAIERDKIELNYLRQQNELLERRVASVETSTHQTAISQLDREIASARAEAEAAERVMAKAIEAKNGADATKALAFRDKALARANDLQRKKDMAASRQQPSNPAPGLSPAAAAKARKFMADLFWYDPNGSDEDSAVVLALDTTLARSGLSPESDEYWETLRERVEKRLPERFGTATGGDQRGSQRRGPAGGPAIGSGRAASGSSSGKREVYISPARVQAMKEAGVWDDPVLRQKYVRRYEQFDRENKRK